MATAAATPDFTAHACWADRLAAYRNTRWHSAVLANIADAAFAAGDMDYYHAAQAASDGCAVALSELDELIAEDARADAGLGFPADYFWRDSQWAIDAGMGE